MKIQTYDLAYEKSWIYTKALSYLFSPFFDDMSRSKDEFTEEPYQDSVELIAVEDDQVVGLLPSSLKELISYTLILKIRMDSQISEVSYLFSWIIWIRTACFFGVNPNI